MRLTRFRIRTFMALVAIVALLLGGVSWVEQVRERRAFYLLEASRHDDQELEYRVMSRVLREEADLERRNSDSDWCDRDRTPEHRARHAAWRLSQADQTDKEATQYAELAKYHALMAAKYARAAVTPWWPLEADPPPPPLPPDPPPRKPRPGEGIWAGW